MGEISIRHLRDDTPIGAYLKTLNSLTKDHERVERLAGSYFELVNMEDTTRHQQQELLCGIGHVADMADSVPTQVGEAAQAAFHDDLDPSYKIPDEELFLPLEQQFRLRP